MAEGALGASASDIQNTQALTAQMESVHKSILVTNESLKEMVKVLETVTKSSARLGHSVEGTAKKGSAAMADWVEAAQDFSEELSTVDYEFNQFTRDAKKLNLRGQLPTKELVKLADKIKEAKEEMHAYQVEASKKRAKGALSPKELKEQRQNIQIMQEKLIKLRNEVKRYGSTGESSGDKVRKGFGTLGGMFKNLGSRRGLKDSAEDAQQVGYELKRAGGALTIFGKKSVLIGGAMKGMGSAVGGIGKLMTGPAGWIAMGVKALADLTLAADEFVKTANKNFARVRGPNIMTGDVAGQFKQFNDLLYNAGKNLSVGLNAAQVGEFVEAITQAGVHLDVLNNGFRNYRDAVYVAAKASKTLGADLPMVGNMMGSLINEFRMNIDQIDDLFVQMGFNAQKAGMSTDRFWGAIEQATTSMMFYGVGMDSASKQMASFAKSQTMGLKDASEMVTEYGQSFVKMSNENRAAFLDLVKSAKGGGAAINGAFKKVQDSWTDKAKALSIKIQMKEKQDQTPEVVEQLSKLRDEQAAAMSKAKMATDAYGKNSVAQAPYLPMIAESTMALTGLMIKGQVGSWTKLQGENIWIAQEIAKATGMSADLIMKSAGVAKAIDAKMKTQLGFGAMGAKNEKSVLRAIQGSQKLSDDQTVTMDNLLASVKANDPESEAGIAATNNLAGFLKDTLKIDMDTAADLAKMAVLDKQGTGAFTGQLKNMLKMTKAQKTNSKVWGEQTGLLEKNYDQALISDSAFEKQGNLQLLTQTEMKDRADDTFRAINKQTLSYKEMLDIAKSDVQWRVNSLSLFQGINTGINDLVTLFAGSMNKLTGSQKDANDWLIANTNTKKGDMKDGVLTGDAQKNIIKETVKQIAILNEKIQGDKLTAEGIAKAVTKGSVNDQIASLQSSIEKITSGDDYKKLKSKETAGTLTKEEKGTLGAQDAAVNNFKAAQTQLEVAAAWKKRFSAPELQGSRGPALIEKEKAELDKTIKAFEGAQERAAIGGGEPLTEAESAQLKALKLIQKTLGGEGKLTGKLSLKQLRSLGDLVESTGVLPEIQATADKQLADDQEALQRQARSLTELTQLNAKNAQIVEFQKALVMADEGARKQLIKGIKTAAEKTGQSGYDVAYGKGLNLDEYEGLVNEMPKELGDNLVKQFKSLSQTDKNVINEKRRTDQDNVMGELGIRVGSQVGLGVGAPGYKPGATPKATGGPAKGKIIAGEKGPEVIDLDTPARVYTAPQTKRTFPGMGALDVKRPPSLMGGFTSTGGLADAQTVNKNITFNVSIGFSGDLASKIRNEIKAMAQKELA